MTTRTQQRHEPRWVLVFLAAMVAALVAILVGNVSSASAAATAETRVGASSVVVEPLAGPPEHIAAGQRLGNDGQRVVVVVATGVAANGVRAESAMSGALLKDHLRQLQKYGQGGFRELESGRFRYYGELSPASKSGDMVGRRLVREWDPATGGTRTWHETIDRSGTVRIVRPETGGSKTHYYFDELGNFGGSW